jgi:MFS transporter, SP family, general alpha glucoside:H+ symporter
MYLINFVIVFIGITVETVATTNPVFFAGKFINGFAVGAFIATSMTYIGEVRIPRCHGNSGLTLAIDCASSTSWHSDGCGCYCLHLWSVHGVSDRELSGEPALAVGIPRNLCCSICCQRDWCYSATIYAGVSSTQSSPARPLLTQNARSPWWLISRDKEEKAIRSLRRLGGDTAGIEKRVAYIKLTLEKVREETEGVTYLECFRKSNLRRTMIAIAPMSIQALCGVFFVAAYSTYYLQLAGYSTQESFKLAIVQQVLSMLGNITSWFIIDKVGRRNISVWGLALLTILLFVTGGLAAKGTPGCIQGTVALLWLYAYLYNATIGATAYTALSEVATARLRAKTAAIGLALQNGLFVSALFVLFSPNMLLTERNRPCGRSLFLTSLTPTKPTSAPKRPSSLEAFPSSARSISFSATPRRREEATRSWMKCSSNMFLPGSSGLIRLSQRLKDKVLNNA